MIDFTEGRVCVPDFIEYCEKHPEILDFLTKIADPKFKTCIVHKRINENGFAQFIPEELPFDANLFLTEQLKANDGRLGAYLNIHSLFSQVLTTAFPDEHIVIDRTLIDKFKFVLEACPEHIGGQEVEDLLERILESLPANFSKTKRIKIYKEQLKLLFHLEPNKYPRWVQGAEWPMGEDDVPMKFISQKRKRGKAYENMFYTEFLFEDVKTGKQRAVEQFT